MEPASVKEFAVANSFTSEVRWEGKRKLKRAKEGNGEQRDGGVLERERVPDRIPRRKDMRSPIVPPSAETTCTNLSY